MERTGRFIKEANESWRSADHLAYITYPMIREPKLLLSIAEKLHVANARIMDALLYKARENRIIPAVPIEFETRLNFLQLHLAKRYGISKDIIDMIVYLNSSIQTHRKNPIGFSRNESYVILSQDMGANSLTIEAIKKYIALTKQFINTVDIPE